MGRTAHSFAVVALVAATAVLAVPMPALAAPPERGSVTATFTDVCGFVMAAFANADPRSADAFIRFSRNGKLLDSAGSRVDGGGSATLYQVAASGDQIHYDWKVKGGTETLDHTHVTPAGCDEPKLAVSLIDSCGPDFTISVANAGTGAADVLIRAPMLHNAPYTVPAGGKVTVTVPGVSVSGAWVGRLRPDAGGDTTKTAVVDAVQRSPGCGIPWPNDNVVTFTSTCDKVSFILYALDMQGTLSVRRNGAVVLQQPLDHDIYKFAVDVTRGDVVKVGDSPPLLTYTHNPPASCTPAVATSAGPSTAATGAGPSPSLAAVNSGPSPAGRYSASGRDDGRPAETAAGSREIDATPFALITVGLAAAVLVFGSGGRLLIGALRRRRRLVWAVAFETVSPEPAVHDIGVIPTTSVRWIARAGSTARYLREDMA